MKEDRGLWLQKLQIRRNMPLFLALVFCFSAFITYRNLPEQKAVSVLLADQLPGNEEVSEILKQEKETGSDEKICFYQDCGLMTVQEPDFGRNVMVSVAKIQGDASVFDWRIQGFSDEDRKGCIIDRKTSRDLFGTDEASGRQLSVQNQIYEVRKVVAWKQNLVLIHTVSPENRTDRQITSAREIPYGRVLLEFPDESCRTGTEQFLLRYGLRGKQYDGQIPGMAGIVMVWMVPLLVWLDFLLFAVKQKKSAVDTIERLFWQGVCVLLCVILAFMAVKNSAIPVDWIPGKWSDFSFWSERLREEKEKLGYFLRVSHTVVETEWLMGVMESAGKGLAGGVMYLIYRRRQPQ